MSSNLLSFFPKGVVAFDLETTGLSPLFDKIIEIGAVKISADGSTSHFQELIQPGIPISSDNTLIHGITDSTVADAPSLQEVLPRFMDFVGDASLVAHNAKFDTGFVVFALHQQKSLLPDNSVYCSLALSRSIFKEAPNNRLGTLAKLLSIAVKRHHRAWDDAWVCLQLVAKALEKLGSNALTQLQKSRLYSLGDYRDIDRLPTHLTELIEPVASRKSLSIKYTGGSTPGDWRPITLQSLLPLPTGNVLYALCHRSNQYKFFYLKRIQAFKEL